MNTEFPKTEYTCKARLIPHAEGGSITTYLSSLSLGASKSLLSIDTPYSISFLSAPQLPPRKHYSNTTTRQTINILIWFNKEAHKREEKLYFTSRTNSLNSLLPLQQSNETFVVPFLLPTTTLYKWVKVSSLTYTILCTSMEK